MHLVLGVMELSTFLTSIHNVSSSISTKTGFAPHALIAWKSAVLLKDGVITSSPLLK